MKVEYNFTSHTTDRLVPLCFSCRTLLHNCPIIGHMPSFSFSFVRRFVDTHTLGETHFDQMRNAHTFPTTVITNTSRQMRSSRTRKAHHTHHRLGRSCPTFLPIRQSNTLQVDGPTCHTKVFRVKTLSTATSVSIIRVKTL
jgi:hypothetical protein